MSIPRDGAVPEFLSAQLPEDEDWGAWLLTHLGIGLDAMLLGAMRLVIDAALTPDPAELPALRAAAEPYVTDELMREPRRFFAFLDEQPPPTPAVVSEHLRRELRGGAIVARQFLSRYGPYHETDDADCPENERIPVEHWMHGPGRPKGTVLALHGFTMGHPRIDRIVMMAADWFAHGLDVALLTLPYHGARAPRGTRFSGQRFAAPNPAQLNEAMRQAVHDTALVANWLRAETQAPVGLLGLSLGGYVTALTAGLTDALDFAIPIIPPVDLADLAWRSFVSQGRLGARPPFTRDEHRAAYRVHCPLVYPLRLPKERVMIVAGRGDRIVPPDHPHTLWKHWGEPRIHWFSGSHIAPFGRGRIIKAITEHLHDIGIL